MHASNLGITHLSSNNICFLHQFLDKQDVVQIHLPNQLLNLLMENSTKTSAFLDSLWSGSWALIIRRSVLFGNVLVIVFDSRVLRQLVRKTASLYLFIYRKFVNFVSMNVMMGLQISNYLRLSPKWRYGFATLLEMTCTVQVYDWDLSNDIEFMLRS